MASQDAEPSAAERAAIDAAHAAGRSVRGSTSPNPPVGAAILDARGELIATGATEPPGGRHAEIVALDAAGPRARGATMAVTLEPCAHVGRTGPCAEAIIAAGISRVLYCQQDPTPAARGGAARLQAAGVATVFLKEPSPELQPWLAAVTAGRPSVTLKFAQTLDGFIAAADGTSQWITGPEARQAVHEDRALRDAIVVGTGTAIADNPRLSARDATGRPYPRQPRRVVIGTRDLPEGSHLHAPEVERFATIDEALSALWDCGARDVLVEGGAGLATSFVERGLVDFLQAYVAPALLGEGRSVFARELAGTIAQAPRFELFGLERLGPDVRLDLEKRSRNTGGAGE